MWRRKNVKQHLDWAEKQLDKMGIPNGRRVARVLLDFARDGAPSQRPVPAMESEPVASDAARDFKHYIFRRMRGETISRIMGQREFWSLNFKLNEATLDPRQDTEALVEAALEFLRQKDADYKTKPWRLMDFGTGTGCIIIALLHELPNATGVACDISPLALQAARENAVQNNVGDRLSLFAGNWADAARIEREQDKFDVIVSNPPYLPEFYRGILSLEVANFDPPASLWGGPLGLDAYAEILPQIRGLLKKDGLAGLEMGADQADGLAQIVADNGFVVRDMKRDLSGHARCLLISQRENITVI